MWTFLEYYALAQVFIVIRYAIIFVWFPIEEE